MRFDTVLMVDWSGGNDRGPTPKKDAIWVCAARGHIVDTPVYLRNRQQAESWINAFLTKERKAGRKVLVGFDFAFGYPTGFGRALTGDDDPFAIWDWFEARVLDAPDRNNRFDIAGQINDLFAGIGPFWGNGLKRDIAGLPRKGLDRSSHGMPEKRAAEAQTKGAFPVWQLSGAGAVGSQVIMGLPVLSRLRKTFSDEVSVWPFEACTTAITLIEIWPSLISHVVNATIPEGRIKDAHQVQLLAQAVARMDADTLRLFLDVPRNFEGWIFGIGHEETLSRLAYDSMGPPMLSNDCFAMPQGAHWTPVDEALTHLKEHLSAVTSTIDVSISDAARRYLALDVIAARSHPPAPNAAVDGYGFAGPAPEGLNMLPLVSGRAAAGAPFEGTIPQGHAIRILTGANIPDGVDTVVLQEDVRVADGQVSFHGPLKKGANARRAGEDMQQGQVICLKGTRLTPGDIGMIAASGVGNVKVHRPLRVGILSTGDELVPAGQPATDGQIFDANGPMLASLVGSWGYEVVSLGRAPDNRAELRLVLDAASAQCDTILTSGGASAGAEDHVSALLSDTGSFALWRIAMKPGRPLVLGMWQGTPVFGLPGNPVAAMVCALVFASPALRVLAGGKWEVASGYMVPAAFNKSKKAGRSEYLRARIKDGTVEIFPSEGSGRVSGLAWATGLVALDPPAISVQQGDLVRFIPFAQSAM